MSGCQGRDNPETKRCSCTNYTSILMANNYHGLCVLSSISE